MRMFSSVVVLCLIPVAALGSDELDLSKRLFDQMEYRRALKVLNQALKSPDNGPDELVEAYRIKGLCLSAVGKPDEAVFVFKKLLSINPSYKSSVKWSVEISPKLVAPFYQAVEKMRNMGCIAMKHIPPGPTTTLGGLKLNVALLSDPLNLVKSIRFRFQKESDERERRVVVKVDGTGSVPVLLPSGFKAVGISYFFEAVNEHGGVLSRIGSKKEPFRLGMEPILATMPPLTPVGRKDGVGGDGTILKKEARWYQSWWFWTVVGVAVAGAATGTALALSGGGSSEGPADYGIGWGVKQ